MRLLYKTGLYHEIVEQLCPYILGSTVRTIPETVARTGERMQLRRKPVLAPQSVEFIREPHDFILGSGDEQRARILRHLRLGHGAIDASHHVGLGHLIMVIEHLKCKCGTGGESYNRDLVGSNVVFPGIPRIYFMAAIAS